MKSVLLGILISQLVVRVASVPSVSPLPPSTVDLGYARYQGATVQDRVTGKIHTVFLGLRYAASPTGTARFNAPNPPLQTPGVTIANAQPPMCLQASAGAAPATPFRNTSPGLSTRHSSLESLESRAVSVSEDCLFLNVYVPGNLGEKKNLPVVVWIHGGGYAAGSASAFDGNDLIRESNEGVIAVLIQYRLGVFGFLPGQKVKDGGALNAGLLDQQFALRWVQKNIKDFGGDPTQVTIWGESAGAGSVLQHVVANGGHTSPPLFRGALFSSAYLPSQYRFNDPIAETLYSQTVAQTNCTSSKNTLACLQNSDVNALQAANVKISLAGFSGVFVFVPVVDGSFITERPTQLLQGGRLNGNVALAITNAFEGTIFVNQTAAATFAISDYVSQLYPKISPQNARLAAAQYAGTGTNTFQVNAIYGESIFICPTYFILSAFSGRSFKGEFAIPPALHGNDVAYYFPSTNPTGVPPFANPAFDQAFSELFLDFTVALNPNKKVNSSDVLPSWPLWNGSNEMLFNQTASNAPEIQTIKTSSALLKRCQFWQSVAAQTAQ